MNNEVMIGKKRFHHSHISKGDWLSEFSCQKRGKLFLPTMGKVCQNVPINKGGGLNEFFVAPLRIIAIILKHTNREKLPQL